MSILAPAGLSAGLAHPGTEKCSLDTPTSLQAGEGDPLVGDSPGFWASWVPALALQGDHVTRVAPGKLPRAGTFSAFVDL